MQTEQDVSTMLSRLQPILEMRCREDCAIIEMKG